MALRDSEILALPHDDFIAAAQAHPEVMIELARLMILRARQAGSHAADPTVFGFIGVSERPIRPFVDLVEAEIAGMGFSVKTIDSTALRSAAGWFSAIEETHDVVLYAAEGGEPAWAHLCARQVDRLFIVGRSNEPPPAGRLWGADPLQDQRLVDLILIHKPTTEMPWGTEAWLKSLTPTRWFHVKGGDRADAARIARVLTGTSVGLVLSGGGARAYAHMGVVKALKESGTPLDFVGGASMGAIIGAGVAMGWSYAEEDARIRKAFVESSPVDDIGFPIVAMARGRKVNARLFEHFGDTQIADLWRPFFSVASNITSGGYVVDKEGLLRDCPASLDLPARRAAAGGARRRRAGGRGGDAQLPGRHHARLAQRPRGGLRRQPLARGRSQGRHQPAAVVEVAAVGRLAPGPADRVGDHALGHPDHQGGDPDRPQRHRPLDHSQPAEGRDPRLEGL